MKICKKADNDLFCIFTALQVYLLKKLYFNLLGMRLKLANFYNCRHLISIFTIFLGFTLNSSGSYAASNILASETDLSQSSAVESDLHLKFDSIDSKKTILAKLPVLPETVKLVKNFEGFRPYAYIDSSGLPVIGYGQTRINGRIARMGQFISKGQADLALEAELAQIQKLVVAHVRVELNPYQLGALTSLVYNAGTVVIKNSTLIRKLNAGDYTGASREFVRWNKANRGGKLVVFPGLTKRRLAEQKLFLTPYGQLVSNN